MNISNSNLWASAWSFALAAGFFLASGEDHALRGETAEEAVSLDQDALIVDVEAGIRRVRVQFLNHATGKWETFSIAHLEGKKGRVKLRIPPGLSPQEIKVHLSGKDHLSHTFFSGKSRFEERVFEENDFNAGTDRFGIETLDNPASNLPAEDPSPVVEESDIWKIKGNTLYFFNQLRGLQIFDLSAPEEPVLRHALRLPAVGEELYLLEDNRFLLLTNLGWDEGSELLLGEEAEDGVAILDRFPLPGLIFDSRRVGGRLFIASREYRNEEEDGLLVGRQSVRLSVFNLSEGEHPREVSSLRFSGYGSAMTATEGHILLALRRREDWNRSTVHVIGTTDPEKPLARVASVDLDGSIADQYKMQLKNGILTTISQVWGFPMGDRRNVTRLETFSIAPERDEAVRLATLELAENESLHATRFDGDRVYIVTFFRIDPLWIVDLSNPERPLLAGELEIPGWSTYLEPMGDRLLAVGVEERRVTVSLFDVADPFSPALLERLPLGDGFSWSEAVYDEKAVNILPAAGLVLVPFQDYHEGESRMAVQLIDLEKDALRERGVIRHQFHPRRAALLEGNLVSLSQRELLLVDAGDRDFPELIAALEIAWPVDRLFTVSDYLIQIDDSLGGNGESAALRLTEASEPEIVLKKMPLGKGRVVGADLREDFLYLAQVAAAASLPEDGTGDFLLKVSLWDVSDPENPFFTGSVETPLPGSSSFWNLEALWPAPETLVWYSRANGFFIYGNPYLDVPLLAENDGIVGEIAAPDRGFIPLYQNAVSFYAFDVVDKSAPAFQSAAALEPERAWEFSKGFSLRGFLFLSFNKVRWGDGEVRRGSFLQVIDYDEPENPLFRNPVRIPGRLEGVLGDDPESVFLFTSAASTIRREGKLRRFTHFQASVYDGVNVFQVDEVSIREPYYTPLAADGRHIYKARPPIHDRGSEILHLAWTKDGFFEFLPSRFIKGHIQALKSEAGLLLALSPRNLFVADASDPFVAHPLERYPLPSGLWLNLENADIVKSAGVRFPAGPYGVEAVLFNRPFPVAPSLSLAADGAGEVENPEWTEYRGGEMVFTRTGDSDAVGILADAEWLFIPDGFTPFDINASDTGDGWQWSDWWGTYNDLSFPWILHDEHGWIYSTGKNKGAFWFWSSSLGWAWTSDASYPYIYSFKEGSWLWYFRGKENPRWFYRFSTRDWVNY